ncbi:MAG: N-acyl homoserine lactonase family protein [Oscillospiraceae bacterium]|nr:N-acyl homoserine lactonase family protein [Oscillospiraceae bacterium]
MKLHVLHCGTIRVSEAVPYGNAIDLKNTARQLGAPERARVTLPVCAYLIEHPRGLVLVDAGWDRAISPRGVYDAEAVRRYLPAHLAALYRPCLPEGMAIREQLAARGIRPEDLCCVVLTHLDPDHVTGLRQLSGARRVVLSEDEYFWSCRTVYKLRQPQALWIDLPIERQFYRGSSLGPNRWAIDVFGDGSVVMVNTPGHTDGHASVLVRSGRRFVVLVGDAAFSPRNWREMITPGYGFSRSMQLKSLQWLRTMAEDPDCAAALCSHDPEVPPQTIEF